MINMILQVIVLSLLAKVFGMETEGLNSRVHISEEIAGLKDKIYTAGALETAKSENEIECARRCSHSDGCWSFFYSKDTGICQMHGEELNTTTANPYSVAPGYRYYKVKYTAAVGSLGQPCDSGNCISTNAECGAENICGCKAGYSFQSGTMTCEEDCVQYGNTFQIFPGYHIDKNNEYSDTDITVEKCMQLCIDETTFTCITFEWRKSDEKCYLQSVDALDKPGQYFIANEVINYYQRNCA